MIRLPDAAHTAASLAIRQRALMLIRAPARAMPGLQPEGADTQTPRGARTADGGTVRGAASTPPAANHDTPSGRTLFPDRPGARTQAAPATYQFANPSARFGNPRQAPVRTGHPAPAPDSLGAPGAEPYGVKPSSSGSAVPVAPAPVHARSDAPIAASPDNAAQTTLIAREGAPAVSAHAPAAASEPGMLPNPQVQGKVPRIVVPMHFSAGHAAWTPPAARQPRAPDHARARRRLTMWLAVAGLLLTWIALWAL